ncbi:transglutaminase family protein [Halomonas sp. V046]|uniref:transglutaminase family protein n=1 Tax=Halomonas sp. V046 TaxID=3459611 RepID=UPI00404494A7
MIYRLRHTTRYRYSQSVSHSENEARLTPRSLPWQRVDDAQLAITPGPCRRMARHDAFGNAVSLFAIDTPHQTLEVTLHARVTTLPRPAPPSRPLPWEACRDALAKGTCALSREAQPFLQNSAFIERRPLLAAWVAECLSPRRDLVQAVDALNRHIFEHFTYDTDFSTLETTPQEVLHHRRGVCQDFAHLAIAALRSVGLAARYVSGYLETLPPPGQPRLIGADASHAWFSVLIPGWGWLDFDPTNGTRAGERHLLLGWGRDYDDVAPLKGVVTGGGHQRLEVEVDVIPEAENDLAASTGANNAAPIGAPPLVMPATAPSPAATADSQRVRPVVHRTSDASRSRRR